MNDQLYFADVDLPFHVWVRERSSDGALRWVLRETSALQRGRMAATQLQHDHNPGGCVAE